MYYYRIKYRIENVDIEASLFSKNEHEKDDSILLHQEKGIVTLNENGEQVVKAFPKDVYGTVDGKKLVREGDIIDGDTVVKIHENEIEFEKDGKRWTRNVDGRQY